jgi:hypothetical protein
LLVIEIATKIDLRNRQGRPGLVFEDKIHSIKGIGNRTAGVRRQDPFGGRQKITHEAQSRLGSQMETRRPRRVLDGHTRRGRRGSKTHAKARRYKAKFSTGDLAQRNHSSTRLSRWTTSRCLRPG